MSLELQSYEKLCEIEKILRTIMQWTVEMQTIRLSTDLPAPDYTAEVVDYTDTAPAPSRRRGRPPKVLTRGEALCAVRPKVSS